MEPSLPCVGPRQRYCTSHGGLAVLAKLKAHSDTDLVDARFKELLSDRGRSMEFGQAQEHIVALEEDDNYTRNFSTRFTLHASPHHQPDFDCLSWHLTFPKPQIALLGSMLR